MNAPPPGWPRLTVSRYYDDAKAAIAWLERAFDFQTRLLVEGPNGRVVHSELTYGDAVVCVGHTDPSRRQSAPKDHAGLNSSGVFLYVDDVEAHCARARAGGAVITMELKTSDYGEEYWVDRSYQCEDPEGHLWGFAQRMKTGA